MFVEDYAVFIDPVVKLHREQVAKCNSLLRHHAEIKSGKIKPRPALQDYGSLWSRNYEPTAEDVGDIKVAYAEGRAVPHQIVDLVIAKAARMENPQAFLGQDFPRQFGRRNFYTPERYNADIHPVEVSMLLSSGSAILTSVWLERTAQQPEPNWLVRVHQRISGSEPSEYAKGLALRLLKKTPELVGPLPEAFNQYDELYQAPRGTYRALMTEKGHEGAVEVMADFERARKQAEQKRGAREIAEIERGGIYNGLKRWVRDSLSLQCGPGGY
jgi:hypothetical protein